MSRKSERSFLGHPSAKFFRSFSSEGLFQQPLPIHSSTRQLATPVNYRLTADRSAQRDNLVESHRMKQISLRLVLLSLIGCCPLMLRETLQAQGPAEYTFIPIIAFPHDTSAYTQGLAYRDGFLYEGTGLNSRSSLRKVNLETGTVVQRVDLEPEFFGEGITILREAKTSSLRH